MASILGIPTENIFANQFLFGTSGEFMGFDTNQPTSRSGGKATVIQQIRKASLLSVCLIFGCWSCCLKLMDFVFQAHGNETIVMVGDGATDLEVSELIHTSKLCNCSSFQFSIG